MTQRDAYLQFVPIGIILAMIVAFAVWVGITDWLRTRRNRP